MSRSFPTRLVDSADRVVLLAPCLLLLICSACATPFPIEDLEEGMTYETVRENFGEPELIKNEPRGAESSWWFYEHEEKGLEEWVNTLIPLSYISIPLNVAVGDSWDDGYVRRGSVVLDFEEERLVGWEVLFSGRAGSAPPTDHDSGWMHRQMNNFLNRQQGQIEDAKHHAKGHTHHHGDDDGC